MSDFSARIDVIERGYEYLLAYAAQGRQSDEGSEARPRLLDMFQALDGLGALLAQAVGPVSDAASFLEAVEQDASKARGRLGWCCRGLLSARCWWTT